MSSTIGLTYANDKHTDGAGAQLQRIYGIYALSRFLGLPYIHSPLKRIGYEGLEALQRNSSSAGCELKYNDLFKLESDVHLPEEDAVIHEMELVDTEVIKQIQIAKAAQLDTSKNSRAANSACLFGRLDSGLFPVRFLNVRNGEAHR